jgi:hypothetical protein
VRQLERDLRSTDQARRFDAQLTVESLGLELGTGPVRMARPGPAGHSRAHFEQVAAEYRAALKRRPRAPIAALRDQYPGVSESTLRRWTQRARDMGLLGPSRSGRAGEHPRKEGE